MGFDFARHFAGRARPHRFVGERRFQPFGQETAADIADGMAVTAEDRGNFAVRARFALRTVEQQKDTGARLLSGRILSGANHAFELLTLFGGEGKKGMFCYTTILPAFRDLQNFTYLTTRAGVHTF